MIRGQFIMRSVMLSGVVIGLIACGERPLDRARLQRVVLAQCPIGSSPQLSAGAVSGCSGEANGSILEQNGEVVGGCRALVNARSSASSPTRAES